MLNAQLLRGLSAYNLIRLGSCLVGGEDRMYSCPLKNVGKAAEARRIQAKRSVAE